MKFRHVLGAVALAIGVVAPVAKAQLLYEQSFPTPGPDDGAIADFGWSVDLFPTGGFSGTYDGTFDPYGLRVAANDQKINGNSGVYIGVGSFPGGPPIMSELGMFSVTDGSGGFTTIDPAACEELLLTVFANLQAGGVDDYGYFSVQLGDGDPRTADEAWYISSSPMAAPTASGVAFDFRSLVYDPAPGNWNALSLGPVAIGAPAGDLSGLLITGVGVVQQISNPPPLPDYSNADAYGSWNYADYRIFCAPEPTGLVLLVLAAPAALAFRRRI
jgi:hypothetical protein